VTALRLAVSLGHQEIVQILLDAGADVNAQSLYFGSTPLWIAAGEGHLEIVRTLLDAGADVNAQNDGGTTALSNAASEAQRDIVRMLLDAGADVDKGEALIRAAWDGHQKIVRTLLDAGADVNVQNRSEDTALISAAKKGHYRVARTLIDAGADVHIIGRNGSTAISTTRDPRIIFALFMAGDDIRNISEGLYFVVILLVATLFALIVWLTMQYYFMKRVLNIWITSFVFTVVPILSWLMFDIFVLGKCSPLFGCEGTLQIGTFIILVSGLVSSLAVLASFIVANKAAGLELTKGTIKVTAGIGLLLGVLVLYVYPTIYFTYIAVPIVSIVIWFAMSFLIGGAAYLMQRYITNRSS
jgi:hypothetical protein